MMAGARFGWICAFLWLAGCAPMQITSDYDPSVDFTALRTWGWMPRAESDKKKTENLFVDARARQAVERELEIKGYRRQAGGSADFLIGIQTAVETKRDVVTIHRRPGYTPGPYYGYPAAPAPGYPPPVGYPYPYGGYGGWGGNVQETHTYEYDEGTLIIDFIDPKTWNLVWRGSALAEVNRAADPEKKRKRVDEAVRRILERFPPGP